MLRVQVAIAAAFVLEGCARDHAAPAAHEVAVVVDAPGLSAEGVEREIVEPLERALAGVAGVRATRSIASPDTAVVACGFASASAARAARAEVIAKLAEVSLPDGATAQLDAPEAVGELAYALRTDMLTQTELRALQDWVVRPQLAAIPGVVDLHTCGAAPAEVIVRADPARLAANGLDLEAILSAIHATSSPGGAVDLLRDLPIAERGGAVIHLGEVATVSSEAGPAACQAVRATGGPSMIGFVELGDRGAARAVLARLRELGPELPRAVQLELLWERAPLHLQLRLPPASTAERAKIAGRLAAQLIALDATVVTGDPRADSPSDLVVLVPHKPGGPGDRTALAAVEAAARALPELGPVRGGAPELVVRATGPELDDLDHLLAALRTHLDPAVTADLVAAGEVPFLDVELDRDSLARFGISPGAARDVLAAHTAGLLAGELFDASRRLPIRVVLDGDLDSLRLTAPDGAMIPLSAVTIVHASTTHAAITHRDGRRTAALWLRGASRAAARRAIAATPTPPGYTLAID